MNFLNWLLRWSEQARYFRRSLRYEKLLAMCESPVEKMFFESAWRVLPRFIIWPQVSIKQYRADFAFPKEGIIVEIDGHDFHSTKEQLKHDRVRERRLLALGWTIIRFTGSEVYKDSDACAEEVGQIINERNKLKGRWIL